MNLFRISALVLSVVMVSALFAPAEVSAQQRRGGLGGDWHIKMKFNERDWESILSFSRDAEGNRVGHWISFFGVNELKDLSFEDGKLKFVQVRQNRNGDTVTSNFEGTVAEGKLTGKLSNDRGEFDVEVHLRLVAAHREEIARRIAPGFADDVLEPDRRSQPLAHSNSLSAPR